jgi:hypothetical protein
MILRSVGVLSAAKLSGALGALGGLIAGGMMALISMVGIAVNAQQNGPQFPAAFLGLGAIIFIPIFYGIVGFIMGAIYGALYNFVAGLMGGLELELEFVPGPAVSNSP